jgi:hypothetical protein
MLKIEIRKSIKEVWIMRYAKNLQHICNYAKYNNVKYAIKVDHLFS